MVLTEIADGHSLEEIFATTEAEFKISSQISSGTLNEDL